MTNRTFAAILLLFFPAMVHYGQDATGKQDINTLFPEFYSYNPVKVKDTTYKYECYDRRDSIVNVDTLHDIRLIRYISVFKNYDDPVHTYDDNSGVTRPLPMSSIVRRYDKVSDTKWMSIDYTTKKYATITEDRSQVVRTETVTRVSPAPRTPAKATIRYYKAAQ